MSESPELVAVALCSELGGFDTRAFAGQLESAEPGLRVEVVQDLCSNPEAGVQFAHQAGARLLVGGLCGHETRNVEFQAWARRAGLDPYAFDLVSLRPCFAADGAAPLTEHAVFLLRAAVARMREFRGSRPEQLNMRLVAPGKRVSRRALITLPPWTYDAAPMVDPAKCVACGLCETACAYDAISREPTGDRVVDTAHCLGCGQCLAACPVDALDWPVGSKVQFEAEMGVLASSGGRLLIGCASELAKLRSDSDADAALHGWLPIEVPCMGMVTAGWALQALAGGAAAVALVGCGEHCHFDQESVLRERVDYVRDVLDVLGEAHPDDRVLVATGEPASVADALAATAARDVAVSALPGTADRARRAICLTEPEATAGAVLALVDDFGGPVEGRVDSAASPLALVNVHIETCTTCGACALVCPTGALKLEENDDATTLSFDATRCIGCMRCAPSCPEFEEQTLTVDRATDPMALGEGRRELKRAEVGLCRNCGKPVAPAAMLARIERLLDDDDRTPALMDALTKLCIECRQLAASL